MISTFKMNLFVLSCILVAITDVVFANETMVEAVGGENEIEDFLSEELVSYNAAFNNYMIKVKSDNVLVNVPKSAFSTNQRFRIVVTEAQPTKKPTTKKTSKTSGKNNNKKSKATSSKSTSTKKASKAKPKGSCGSGSCCCPPPPKPKSKPKPKPKVPSKYSTASCRDGSCCMPEKSKPKPKAKPSSTSCCCGSSCCVRSKPKVRSYACGEAKQNCCSKDCCYDDSSDSSTSNSTSESSSGSCSCSECWGPYRCDCSSCTTEPEDESETDSDDSSSSSEESTDSESGIFDSYSGSSSSGGNFRSPVRMARSLGDEASTVRNYFNNMSRKRLHLDELSIDDKVSVQHAISEWVSIGNKAAGRYLNKLTLVSFNESQIQLITEKVFTDNITAVFMLEWWDMEERTLQTILITAEGATVNWFFISDDHQLQPIWTEELQEPVQSINVFVIDERFNVLVGYEGVKENDPGHTDFFEVRRFKKWSLMAQLPGNGKCALTQDGKFLAILSPLEHTVYFYRKNSTNGKFALIDKMRSEGVESVCAFTSGFNQFLGIGGDQAQILIASDDILQAADVRHFDFHHINSFLPVTFGYPSHESILLVEHRLNHNTHSSHTLEALYWNGIHFEVMEHSKCLHNDEENYGFQCITDHLDDNGIQGATVVQNTNIKNILTAGVTLTPLHFTVKADLEDVPDPRTRTEEERSTAIDYIKMEYDMLNEEIEELKLRLNQPREILGRYWKINSLTAPVVNLKEELSRFNFVIGGKVWNNLEDLFSSETKEMILSNHNRIQSIVKKLKRKI